MNFIRNRIEFFKVFTNYEKFVIGSSITGGVSGFSYGMYEVINDSSNFMNPLTRIHKDPIDDVARMFAYTVFGSCAGLVGSALWPIIVPIGRIYELELYKHNQSKKS